MKTHFFTVFTPTYNRAHTLHRVYDSLLAQTFRDFEWLIVDDGSNDNTAELVKKWQSEASFLIRYIYQTNKGKHVASNVGVREAKGKLFMFFDSDDACVPEALERFYFYWDKIPEKEKRNYSTISALCVDMQGNLIGDEYPGDVVDADSAWQQILFRSSGDRVGVNRTDVLKKNPFPEIPGEKFISEGIVWNRIAQSYRARFINKRLKIKEYMSDGLSASSVKIRANNPIGSRLYYRELSELAMPLGQKAKALINYIRFSFHGRIPLMRIIKESAAPSATALLLIPGYFFYRADRKAI